MAQFNSNNNKRIKLNTNPGRMIVDKCFEEFLKNGRELFDIRAAPYFFQWFKNREILLDELGLIRVSSEVWAEASMKGDVEDIALTLGGAVLKPEDFEGGATSLDEKRFAISRAVGWLSDKRNDPWSFPKSDGFQQYWNLETDNLLPEATITSFEPVPMEPSQFQHQYSSGQLFLCCDKAMKAALEEEEFKNKSLSEILQCLLQHFYREERKFFPAGISIEDDEYHRVALHQQNDIIQMATEVKQLIENYLESNETLCSVAKQIILRIVAEMKNRSPVVRHVPSEEEIQQIENEVFATRNFVPLISPEETEDTSSGYVSRETLSSTSTPGTSRALLSSQDESQSNNPESAGESAVATGDSEGLLPAAGDELVELIIFPEMPDIYWCDMGKYYLRLQLVGQVEQVPSVRLKDPIELVNARQTYTAADGGVAAGKYLRNILYDDEELRTATWSGRIVNRTGKKRNTTGKAFNDDPRTTFIFRQLEQFKWLDKGRVEGMEPPVFSKAEKDTIISKVFSQGLPK